MMTGAAATKKKKKVGGSPINLDFLASFVHSSPDPDPGGDVSHTLAARKGKPKGKAFPRSPGCSLDFYPVSSTPAARKRKPKGKALALSPGCSLDFYRVSPPSAPAKGKGKGKRRREEEDSDGEFMGMSNGGVRRDIAGMSDGELRREIAGLTATFRSLEREKRERRQRLLPLLQKEEARRRGIRMDAKDGDGCSRGAHSSEKILYTFDLEDEQTEAASRKYCTGPRKPHMQTRRSFNQSGPRKPIVVDTMYSSKTSPTALQGNKQRVHAVDPKEHDNEKSWQNANNHYSNHAKRSSVGDAIILDDDASSGDDDKRSPTPNSVATTKRPDGSMDAKEKGKKTGDDDIKESLNAIMNVRKEMPKERKIMKMKEMEEWTAAEQRKAVAEERRVALEERKVAMDLKVMEQEQKLMFMDTSHLDAKQKAYVELCRDQVLAKRSMSMMGGFMAGFMGAMGGAMGAMGGGSSANGAMAGGFGAHDAMGGGLGANGTEATQKDEATHGDASDANAANVN